MTGSKILLSLLFKTNDLKQNRWWDYDLPRQNKLGQKHWVNRSKMKMCEINLHNKKEKKEEKQKIKWQKNCDQTWLKVINPDWKHQRKTWTSLTAKAEKGKTN